MKTAGRILGTAFFMEGFEVQDAPRYGAERRGAPIFASVRASRTLILERGVVRRPSLVVVADDTLAGLPEADVLGGVTGDTVMAILSEVPEGTWRRRLNLDSQIVSIPRPEAIRGYAGQRVAGICCAALAARLCGAIPKSTLARAVREELGFLAPSVLEGSWLYTAMASVPAGAQGVRDGLDILLESDCLRREENLQVVVLTGDGAAYGMGLSATSGAIDRGKKDLFSLWTAHHPPYAATVSASEPLDLARKIEKLRSLRGPRMLLALSLSPCPTGWGFEPAQSVMIGNLAVRTGIWPLKEYVDGHIVHTMIPRTRVPVEEYLKNRNGLAICLHRRKGCG